MGSRGGAALERAHVRIVATASDPAQGLTLAKLGSIAGAAVEAFRNTTANDQPPPAATHAAE
jgi:hypothetical protein